MDILAIAQGLLDELDKSKDQIDGRKAGVVMLFEAIRDALVQEEFQKSMDTTGQTATETSDGQA